MTITRRLATSIGLLGACCILASACSQVSGGPEASVEVRVLDALPADDADPTANDDDAPAVTAGDSSDSDDQSGIANAAGNGPAAEGGPAPAGFFIASEPLEPISDRNSLSPDEADLEFGQELSGEIEQIFGADRWNFQGTQGQLLAVDVRAMGPDPAVCRQDLRLYLNDPDGTTYDLGWIGNFGCQAYGPFALPADGGYSLEFGADDGGIISPATGPYSFVATILDDFDEAELQFQADVAGSIDQTFGIDRWTFDATAGQKLAVEIKSINENCRQDLRLFLALPSGERTEVAWIGNTGCRAYGPLDLETDGSYALEFVGGDGGIISPPTGTYTFNAVLG